MTVRPFATLKTNMPINTAGGTSVQDIHDIVDTIEDATTQEVIYTSGSTFTTSVAGNRRFYVVSNATAFTFTVPIGIPMGWECAIMQTGVGQVTVSVPTGELFHPDAHTKTAKQYSMLFLKCIWDGGASGPSIGLSGDTAL
jgi:hypothetical protein